ncbi:MAG: O-antigen ligase family protein [Chloroflexi bacterium]|nr:O-antigen ligase family protein [Chloroflexota bacterium]
MASYIVTGAILLYYLFFQRPQRSTWPVLFVFGGLLYAVLTIASDTTQGAVLERYSNLDTTNRIVLAQQGWQLFLDNPILGVGTANYHVAVASGDYFGAFSGAHNELIRATAEHGVFGLVFWCLFAFASLVTLRGQWSFPGLTSGPSVYCLYFHVL